jgi:hypothetical protein
MSDREGLRLPDAPYAFRPAKRIQRIMFCDALRSLRALRPLEDYQYVGLGHWQFVDFELMRREVGVRQMVSMEKDSNQQARYEENAPFDDITMLFGEAYESLQSDVDLTVPTIAWLDYTKKFEDTTVRDLRYLVERMPVGSVLATTFNCRPERDGRRVEAFERQVGTVPGDVTEDDLDRDGCRVSSGGSSWSSFLRPRTLATTGRQSNSSCSCATKMGRRWHSGPPCLSIAMAI